MVGIFFAYRLVHIPSRVETTLFWIIFFIVPTLKYPKIGLYYLFCLPLFIPMFRRMYYLIADRPTLDYLMLISDGVMGGLILALILLWVINKEKNRDLLACLVLLYTVILFAKIFIGNSGPTLQGLYGFKFNGLYVSFFFGGSYILTSFKETKSIYKYSAILLLITALYGLKQILFGFSGFEEKWLDSIQFTTLRIEGVVRPFSVYASPASMSDGMTILFLMGVYWIFSGGKSYKLLGAIICLAAIWPLLIATVRTNWLAVAAGLVFYLFLLRIKKRWVKVSLMTVIVAGIFIYSSKSNGEGGVSKAVAVTEQGLNKKSLAQIMIKNRTSALANPLQEYSVQKRMGTWVSIFYDSKTHPFGKGQGTAGYAHSYYFQVLGEIGYPGVLLFLIILVVGFYRAFYVIANCHDPNIQEFTRMLLTVIFMLSILNLTGTHLHTPPGDIFFWFSLGCISRFFSQTVLEEKAMKSGTKIGGHPSGEASFLTTPNPNSILVN